MTNYGFSVGSGQKPKQGLPEKYTVRCPHCRALFTLDVSGIEGLETPRFRCSQCKAIFRAEDAEWRPCKKDTPTANNSATTHKPVDPFDFSFDEKEADFQTSSLHGKQWDQDNGDDTTSDWEIPQPSKKSGFDIMANIGGKIDITAPKEVVQTKQKPTEEPQLPLDLNSQPPSTKKAKSLDFEFEPRTENFTYREPLQTTSSAIATDIPGHEPNRWFSTAIFAAPFFCLLLALLGASFYITQTPFNEDGFLRSILPSIHKVPPPGLILSNISFKRVPLQSGEIVHLISGTLQNHTERSFKEVILEGLGFDAGGQKVSALKVNAGATLVKTRVESFSPEMINELQSRESVRHFDLEPGDEQAFTLGLLSDDMNAAKYYSARIYSAN